MSRPVSLTLAFVTAVLASTRGLAAPPTPTPPPTTVIVDAKAKVHPIRWNPAWGKVRAPELVLIGASAGVAIATQIVSPIAKHWRGHLPGDESLRDSMRIEDEGGRRQARDYSDILLTTLVGFPIIIDALSVAGWSRKSPAVAAQMALIDAEVFSVTMAIQGLANVFVSRQRPYVDKCGNELDKSSQDCQGATRFRSFFSGHAAAAFAAASVQCSQQAHLDLYENSSMGGVVCASGLLLAFTTGSLRVAADVHNLSDVLVGASIGTLVGFGLPWLLHYRFGDVKDSGTEPRGPTVSLVPMGLGLGAFGTF